MHEVETVLAILLEPKVGHVRFFKLIQNNNYQEIVNRNIEKAKRIIQQCIDKNIQIILYNSNQYPKELLTIDNYPPILFAKGNLDLLKNDCIAIVGSRNASAIGLKTASEWSKCISVKYSIVSGLARGIDLAAMESAVNHNTIGVLYSGILNSGYKYRSLYENGGLIISEFLPNSPPQISFFAMRNRIISGMSKATIVIESQGRFGTFRTAEFALKQKKQTYVVPGHPFDPHYTGNNDLIKNYNVKIATNVNDIIKDLKSSYQNYLVLENTQEAKLYNLLSTTPVYIEEIANIMKYTLQEVEMIISNADLLYNNIIVSADGKISII